MFSLVEDLTILNVINPRQHNLKIFERRNKPIKLKGKIDQSQLHSGTSQTPLSK